MPANIQTYDKVRLSRKWVVICLLFGTAGPALGYDPADQFRRGTLVLTPQVGGGTNRSLLGLTRHSRVSLVNGTVRVSQLPFDPVGQGAWRGSLEIGFESFFQYYTGQEATAEGLKAAFRYHFLGFSPVVPYVEALAGIAHSSLNVREIDSNHVFLLEAGLGLSYFVTEHIAVTAGYRFQHISNGGTDSPNVSINSSTGVLGVSFFFH